MNDSSFLREIRTEGRVTILRDVLGRLLRARLSGDSLSTALVLVAKQQNADILSHWFDLALTLSPEALLTELSS